MAPEPPLAAEDRALLDRLAARVAELRMETPALLALETARPVSLLASQAMIFFEPFVQALFRLPDYRRFTALVERREALEVLATSIELATDARERAAAQARAAARNVKP
jgi:hypothetical protein